MIIDEITSYDIANHLGMDLSFFAKSMNLFLISFVVLFSLTVYFIVKMEKNRVQRVNDTKEYESQKEIQKYHDYGMQTYSALISHDDYLIRSINEFDNMRTVVSEFLSGNANNPVYHNFITDAKKSLNSHDMCKGRLMDTLNNGENVYNDSPLFINYKQSVMGVYSVYQDVIRLNVNTGEVSNFNIDDI